MFPSFNARALGMGLSASATVELAARHGFAGVDLLVRDLIDAGDDPAEIRARMDDLGLKGGAFPMPVHWRGDEATFAQGLARLPRLAEATATLGLFRTGTWIMPGMPERPQSESGRAAHHEAVAELHLRRLGAIARVLDNFGIRMGLEVIGVASVRTGRGWPFVARLADLDPTLGAVWREATNLGILIDAYHLHAAGEPIETALAWGIEKVVWVHVADLPDHAPPDRAAIRDDDRGLPGESGRIDVRGLLAALSARGYDGPVTAEPLDRGRRWARLGTEATASAVARSLRSVWPYPWPRSAADSAPISG